MKILIYGINYAPEMTGVGKYTGEMAIWLAGRGHDVHVVTAPPYYPAWKISRPYSSWRYASEKLHGVTVWRCPLWVPQVPDALKRLIHLCSFTVSSLPPMLIAAIVKRPDVIIVIEPPLFCAPTALICARLIRASAWLQVQDFEVAAFFGLGFSSSGYLKRVCIALESRLLKMFDMVSSISKAMVERLRHLGVPEDKISFFPNWVDCNTMRTKSGNTDFRRKWNISNDCMVVLYSGNLGKKQGLEILVRAAEILSHKRPDVVFVLVGDGAAKKELLEAVRQRHLLNIIFQPLQPLKDLPSLLCMANVHLIIQRRGVADAVLPSKLSGILAVGGFALITADPHTELGDFVKDNPGIALLVEPENTDAFVQELLATLDDTSLRERGSCLAREYAEQYLHIDKILESAESRFLKLKRK